MKVLIAHNRYRSAAPSGENRVVDTESAALAALGHEVTRYECSSDDIEGWSPARKAALPARVLWSGQAHRELAARLRRERPDVVHVHNTFPLLSAAVLYACRGAGVPVVATVHNYKLECASGDFFRSGSVCHDCAGTLPGRAVVRGCYRESRAATIPVALAMTAHRRAWRSMVSAYIFISAAQRDLLAGLRLDSDRVFVRHNLIPRVAEPRPPRDAVLVYAGRLDDAKGIPILMAGWDHYLAADGERALSLVIAGAGPLDRQVASWASARPSVRLAGQLDKASCARLVAGARAVVVPSAWEETFGLVVVEAMASGVPAIAAGHGSLTELITDDENGVLFPPGDAAALGRAIGNLAAHPDRYEGYGEAAERTHRLRFDPDRNLAQLLGIYEFARAHPVGSARSKEMA